MTKTLAGIAMIAGMALFILVIIVALPLCWPFLLIVFICWYILTWPRRNRRRKTNSMNERMQPHRAPTRQWDDEDEDEDY